MLTNKAQVVTYDFFIALAIFFLVMGLVMSIWYYTVIQAEESMEKRLAYNNLLSASQVWFKEGFPKYWDAENVVELGLSNDGKINETKIEMLKNSVGYSKASLLLNLGNFNFCYEVYDKSGNLIFRFPQNLDLSSARNIYKIERIGILNEQPVKVRTLIWN
ncbi:MAG: hypothetical protein QXR09_01395 [Candidatus Aenigmatarchaeota archaeon]